MDKSIEKKAHTQTHMKKGVRQEKLRIYLFIIIVKLVPIFHGFIGKCTLLRYFSLWYIDDL